VQLEDLKEALNFGWRKRCNKEAARDVHVEDSFGYCHTLRDIFVIGLTDNYSKIKHLFV